MSEPRPIWALLVGIDRFAAQTNLDGCTNDIGAMYGLLTTGYGVDPDAVRVLRDEEATRQGIIDAFMEHLVENPAIERGDQIVFHFSGHGANMIDPLGASPTGYIESLVAHDSGLDGVFNIPDTTVAALLELLSHSKGDNITVVLDCCHSGNGTREGGDRAPKSRLTEPDRRQPPAKLDAELVERATALGVKKRWRQEGLPYTLLAACRDRELAQEYVDYYQDDEPAFGAFTWHLVDALWRLQPNTSYAMLHEQVASKVNVYNPNQMPQCEGNADRSVFGSTPVRRDPFIKVVDTHNGELVLDGGRVHGLGKGAVIELYPADVQRIDDLPDAALGTAEVTWVGASRARAWIETEDPETFRLARARVVQDAADVAPRRAVSLEADEAAEPATKDGLERLRSQIERSSLLRIADAGPAEFVVRAEGANLVIRGNDEPDPLVWPGSIGSSPRAALVALENIARFRRVSALGNDDPASRLQGRLRVQIRKYTSGASPQDMPLIEPRDSEVVLEYDAAAARKADEFGQVAPENEFLVEVINESPTPVFVNALLLNADYSINQLYPKGGEEGQRIDGHASLYIGFQEGTDPLEMYLPGDLPGEAMWTISQNQIKVVATLQPTNLQMLCQGGLEVMPPKGKHRGSGLEALLDQAVSGHRMGRRRRRSTDDWGTGSLAYTCIRKPDGVRIEGGTAALDGGITVHAPDGFAGQVQLTTVGQASRSTDALRPPPGLAGQGLASLGLSGTRGAGSDVVVELTLDEAQRAKIGPDNPLRVAARGSDGLWPIVFDGQDYLLAGRPDADGALITGLPAPAGPASRGALDRTLKLFFYKKTGQEEPTVGLHTVRFEDGAPDPIYSDTKADDVAKGGKALVVVHGFGSGTYGQTRVLRPTLDRLGYDTVLAWDYESFGTPVAETGEAFADALRSAGFGPDDGRELHVVAHSMGGLVSRAMIELSGGAGFVDRLVMAGTPNAGTKLMSAADGLHRLADIAMNKVLGPAVGGVLSWLLQAVFNNALGPADMRPDSAFLKRLNRPGGAQQTVPYLVLDGRGNLGADGGLIKRLAAKGVGLALDLIFGEAHDLVVGSGCITGVQGGQYPLLKTLEVGCNHFDYVVDEPSLAAIRAFLDGGAV